MMKDGSMMSQMVSYLIGTYLIWQPPLTKLDLLPSVPSTFPHRNAAIFRNSFPDPPPEAISGYLEIFVS